MNELGLIIIAILLLGFGALMYIKMIRIWREVEISKYHVFKKENRKANKMLSKITGEKCRGLTFNQLKEKLQKHKLKEKI